MLIPPLTAFLSLQLLSSSRVGVGVGAFSVPSSFTRGTFAARTNPSSSSSSLLLSSSTNTDDLISSASASASTRKRQLIQKAKEIDPKLELPNDSSSITSASGSYCTPSWSNRLGTVLTPLAVPGVYGADRPFYWNKIDVGGRMTVIELPSSSSENDTNTNPDKPHKPDLFIHSPVALDATLFETLQSIGTVKHIVSPNYEHVKYAKMWNEAFPDAYMWACPGLMERMPEVVWSGEIPFGCRPASFYNNDIDKNNNENPFEPVDGMWDWNILQPLHLDIELNPFTGRPFFNEIVFFHVPSKTLLTTDVYWNYPNSDGVPNSNHNSFKGLSGKDSDSDSDSYDSSFETFSWELAPSVEKIPFGSRLWKIAMDKIYKPFYLNLMIPNDKRDEFEKCASFISGIDYNNKDKSITKPWPIETVVPAHGDVLRGTKFVRAVMKDFFNL